MRVQRPSRTGAWMAALALTAILPACGGGGGGGGNAPTTLPPAPVRTLIFQNNFSLLSVTDAEALGIPFDAIAQEFTTNGTGTLEVNADWTFPGSAIAVVVLRGACSFTQIFADACAEAGSTFPASKPSRLTIPNLAAGTYTLVIANVNDYGESGNYQVYLTR